MTDRSEDDLIYGHTDCLVMITTTVDIMITTDVLVVVKALVNFL